MLPGAPYPKDGPGVEVPLILVEEQKVVREEEDVDAQPGCLQGKPRACEGPWPQDPLTLQHMGAGTDGGRRDCVPSRFLMVIAASARNRWDGGAKVRRGAGSLAK